MPIHIGLLGAMPEEVESCVKKLQNVKKIEHGDLTIFSGELNFISSKNQNIYLSIKVFTFFMREKSLILSFLPHFIFIYPNLRRYLKSVIGGINYYLQNKKRVPRNFFGSHRWFS